MHDWLISPDGLTFSYPITRVTLFLKIKDSNLRQQILCGQKLSLQN